MNANAADGARSHDVDGELQPGRHVFLDTWVDGLTVPTFVSEVARAVSSGDTLLVANHNVNSLALLQRDEGFRDFYDRPDLIFVDGAAVVPLSRALGADVRMEHRIAVLDWLWPLCERAEREGWRLVHVGATPRVLERAEQRILQAHPELSLTTFHGYFDMDDPDQNAEVLAAVTAARPTVLLVGMGMPRQERWLLANLDALPPCVIITVGGILSFLGEDRPTAPRWVGRIGMEWLFRLATEPRRLWRRYLVEPFVLVPVVSRALWHRLPHAKR